LNDKVCDEKQTIWMQWGSEYRTSLMFWMVYFA
jgi:hypothetical protein